MFRRFVLLVLAVAAAWVSVAHASDVVRTERGAAIDRYVGRLAAFGISGALFVAKDGETLARNPESRADGRDPIAPELTPRRPPLGGRRLHLAEASAGGALLSGRD